MRRVALHDCPSFRRRVASPPLTAITKSTHHFCHRAVPPRVCQGSSSRWTASNVPADPTRLMSVPKRLGEIVPQRSSLTNHPAFRPRHHKSIVHGFGATALPLVLMREKKDYIYDTGAAYPRLRCINQKTTLHFVGNHEHPQAALPVLSAVVSLAPKALQGPLS